MYPWRGDQISSVKRGYVADVDALQILGETSLMRWLFEAGPHRWLCCPGEVEGNGVETTQ
jgi:hypothetical protein